MNFQLLKNNQSKRVYVNDIKDELGISLHAAIFLNHISHKFVIGKLLKVSNEALAKDLGFSVYQLTNCREEVAKRVVDTFEDNDDDLIQFKQSKEGVIYKFFSANYIRLIRRINSRVIPSYNYDYEYIEEVVESLPGTEPKAVKLKKVATVGVQEIYSKEELAELITNLCEEAATKASKSRGKTLEFMMDKFINYDGILKMWDSPKDLSRHFINWCYKVPIKKEEATAANWKDQFKY